MAPSWQWIFVGRVKPSPVDHAASILSALMPAEVSSRLQHRLTDMGVHLLLKSQLQHLSETEGGIRATLDCNRSPEVDVVVAATGLRPETALAHRAGAETGRGVKVNSYLQTTQPDIYARGLRGNQRPYCLSCSRSSLAPCIWQKPARQQRAAEITGHAGEG